MRPGSWRPGLPAPASEGEAKPGCEREKRDGSSDTGGNDRVGDHDAGANLCPTGAAADKRGMASGATFVGAVTLPLALASKAFVGYQCFVNPPRWGPTPWRIDCVIPEAPLPKQCEVAIVGGGLTGLATAYQLARRGIEVIVLEAGKVGDGASGRTGGIVLEGTAAGELPEASRCISALQALVADAHIECRLDLRGCNEIAHRDDPRGSFSWQDAGRTLSVLRRVPGGTLDPGALISGLARAAVAAGASIHEQSPVAAVEPGSPAVLSVRGRKLMADSVVLALNAFSPALRSLAVPLQPALTLAVRTAALRTEDLDGLGLGDSLPFYTVDLPYLWGRVESNRLILGAGLVFPSTEDIRSVTVDQDEARAAFGRLEQRIRGFHPRLARVTIDLRWGGPVAFREGGTPLLGRHPRATNVIATGAYAGHGVALSARVAQLVADAVVNEGPLPTWGAL